jgi:predicted lysophospholipase L1 biosynthesis ABC-type transport system permease subunit
MNPATLPGISAVMLERPAEIVNYRSMGAAPVILGVGLTIGAALALVVTLAASLRRRRHELALLKTLGFTQRQLRAAVAWQSSVVVVIGTVIGIPFGIALGRGLWNAFANELHVVSEPTVPVVWIGLIAVGSLILANLAAALPARFAGHTPTALVLREE